MGPKKVQQCIFAFRAGLWFIFLAPIFNFTMNFVDIIITEGEIQYYSLNDFLLNILTSLSWVILTVPLMVLSWHKSKLRSLLIGLGFGAISVLVFFTPSGVGTSYAYSSDYSRDLLMAIIFIIVKTAVIFSWISAGKVLIDLDFSNRSQIIPTILLITWWGLMIIFDIYIALRYFEMIPRNPLWNLPVYGSGVIKLIGVIMWNVSLSQKHLKINQPLLVTTAASRTSGISSESKIEGGKEIICSNCQNILPSDNEFCGFCGSHLTTKIEDSGVEGDSKPQGSGTEEGPKTEPIV